MADKLADELIRRNERRLSDRQPLDATYQDIVDYVIPRRGGFSTPDQAAGVQRRRQTLDSTAPRALELFASFLFTLLNSPATRWVRLGVRDDPGLATRSTAAAQWFEKVASIIQSNLAGAEGNLYANLHEVYFDLGAFGTSLLYLPFDSARDVVASRHCNLADATISTGADGRVDSVDLVRRYSARAALQRWRSANLGRAVENASRTGNTVRFLHSVFPTDDSEMAEYLPANFVAKRFGYASVWSQMEDRTVVEVGGFEEFPYAVPRWYTVSSDVYGRSPAMTMLPDIRMVNRMSETILRGAEKIVDPPLVIPDGGLVSPVRMFPGGLTFSDGAIEPKTLIPPGTSRIETGNALLEQRQQAIREGFLVPLFVTPDNPVKTATQVLQEVDERNKAAAPSLVRVQTELFQPTILRAYRVLERAGLLPPPPDDVVDQELTVDYVSPLVASQKQLEALGVMRVFEGLAPWAQVDPGVFDRFDPDTIVDVMVAGSTAPASIMRTRQKAAEIRRERQKMQTEKEGFAAALQAVEAGAKLQAAQRGGAGG